MSGNKACVMTTDETVTSASTRRRSKVTRRAKRSQRNWFFQQVNDGRMDWWMLAVAALFTLVSAQHFSGRLRYYAEASMDWTPAETVYGHGEPVRKRIVQGGEIWSYDKAESRLDVRFAYGRVVEVRCTQTRISGRCEQIFGVKTGTHERTIWQQWGQPNRVRFAGDYKYLMYDDVGLNITLFRYQVTSIALEKRSPASVSYIIRFLRMMIP